MALSRFWRILAPRPASQNPDLPTCLFQAGHYLLLFFHVPLFPFLHEIKWHHHHHHQLPINFPCSSFRISLGYSQTHSSQALWHHLTAQPCCYSLFFFNPNGIIPKPIFIIASRRTSAFPGVRSVTGSTAWVASFSNQIPALGIPSGRCPSKHRELLAQGGKIRIFWGKTWIFWVQIWIFWTKSCFIRWKRIGQFHGTSLRDHGARRAVCLHFGK